MPGLQALAPRFEFFDTQNAIDCVSFFVDLTIKSHRFSDSMPTVGGKVHVVILEPGEKLRFVSEEVYEHDGLAWS